ncbi:MAG: LPS export ABC transporter permease LptG [Desulfobacterales bacterium]|nr:LPS export ABC transporter permease LptG [Desulfobacterales bacterium]
MTIIYKYLIKEIARFFAIILILVVGVYVAVDFFEKIDDFMEANLSIFRAGTFFFYKIPFIIAQIIPVGILLSTLIVFGLLNKNNELVALKSSGVSLYYLLKPVLAIGIVGTVLLFFISEAIVPFFTVHANKIWHSEVKKSSAISSKEKNIWIKDNRSITHIKYYEPKTKDIFGITVYEFDDKFRLNKRMDAEKGSYEKGVWKLNDLIEQRITGNDPANQIKSYVHKEVKLNFMPDDLMRVVKKSEEMSFWELKSYIKKIRTEGYDATAYFVDLQAKVALPFACIIMSIMGIGVAAGRKVKEGLPLAIAGGLGITFLYWISYSFCVSLGYGEILPPLVAVWIPNLIFISLSAYVLLHAE